LEKWKEKLPITKNVASSISELQYTILLVSTAGFCLISYVWIISIHSIILFFL